MAIKPIVLLGAINAVHLFIRTIPNTTAASFIRPARERQAIQLLKISEPFSIPLHIFGSLNIGWRGFP